jgi:acyl-CoA thioesterase I
LALQDGMMTAVLTHPAGPHRRPFLPRAGWRILLTVLLVLGMAPTARADQPCPRSPSPRPLNLPNLRGALAAGQEAVIVALGSSSTEGIGASGPSRAYPAVLQVELNRLLPSSHVAVVNRGIGGQDAAEELARLERDAIAVRPQLVIWQVGANAAMRHTEPADFQRLVTEGVERLTQAHIDVVLMDNQRSPRIIASPTHAVLEHVLLAVAAEEHANLFSRAALMDSWNGEGAPFARFIAADGLHHNDLGYACFARVLAARIADSVHTAFSLSASR